MTTPAAQTADGMRTPLTCILGYVELLLDDPAGALTREQRRHLEAVARSALALERLAAGLEGATGAPRADVAGEVVDLAARRRRRDQAARRRGGR
jgi:signal transduction histidine kinase